ncbi:NAD(P)-binding protein [Chitinophaga agrisoli]|uniref:NAD(P)-binding protein n=1 Tax=Chitinophaga agrisoli TaxID=2607653 RepID=A0A5B2VM17_9BACT|nr:NAD(P)/FAD-dependent oxidoreductase [Chitinophaga agrisoli]KAA2239748.1 NAD(P)-binding protein [Chitinophaga agrisoli]
MNKYAIIAGAGPAGLTAAYELLKRTDITPIILEKSGDIGGISKTVNYKGNRIDIGGHRFFSKSDRVMNWWQQLLPIEKDGPAAFTITYQQQSREIDIASGGATHSAEKDPDKVMLVRKRLSRIYFLRKFFSYPIQLSFDTLTKLGLWTTISILFSYLQAQLLPRRPEKNLEDFMINRFGRSLYQLFFKDYTEKVWGIPCHAISAEWGAQRIKGVSISKAVRHAVQAAVRNKQADLAQKDTETSLIEQFLYPKLGPGQLWEEAARQVQAMGGKVLLHHEVKRVYTSDNGKQVTAVAVINNITGETSYLEGDYFFSTMPVQELIGGMDGSIPEAVKQVASGLQYRDFITVGILLQQLSFRDKNTGEWQRLQLEDTWIYIQEKDVKVGRLQLFNNWSPYMVNDPDTAWVGMEFFCNTEDSFWQLPDEEIKQLAIRELEKIGLASAANVLDATVIRMEKTYPAYFGAYERFNEIRDYVDRFENLFLVGRNGMHKYNNSDHSMLTAMVAVDNIVAGIKTKDNIWSINTEQAYHEEKREAAAAPEERTSPQPAPALSFKHFVFRTPRNKVYLWLAGIAILLQFGVFKYFYPYASFINDDSYVYLETAYHNLPINTYPVGYPNFLRLFSVFSRSDLALVAFQYLSLQAALLGFLFTVFYFYQPGRYVERFLLAFLVLNPVFLYLANYISSDTLFITLSLVWFTLLLWVVQRPATQLILWHGLVLFVAFTVRYNALYYPLIAGIAYLLSPQRRWIKLAGPVFGLLLIGVFVLYTGNIYKRLTGTRQFSPFTGWQLANNAMYAYRYVDSADRKPAPKRLQPLDNMVRHYFDTSRNLATHPAEQQKAGTAYMWTHNMPLQQYMRTHYRDTTHELKRWASLGPLYADYGNYLIKQYPLTFLQYYIWPNAKRYYAPPVEFLQMYSTGKDSVALVAQAWFAYDSRKITTRANSFNVYILNFLPVVAGGLQVVFLLSLIYYVLLQGYRQQPWMQRGIWLTAALWSINFGFSIFASPIALRFQLFPIIVAITFTALFVEYIIKAAYGQLTVRSAAQVIPDQIIRPVLHRR